MALTQPVGHYVSGHTPKNTYESCSVSAYYRSLLTRSALLRPPRTGPTLHFPPCRRASVQGMVCPWGTSIQVHQNFELHNFR